jgi:hypothetical protein
MTKPPQTKFQQITPPGEDGMMSPSAVFACPRCGTTGWDFCLFRHPDDPKPSVVKRCDWELCRYTRGKWMTYADAEALRERSGRDEW